jgi:hypothetical protein
MLKLSSLSRWGWCLGLLVAVLLAPLVPARAQQPAAEVRSVTGVAFAQASGNEVRVLQTGAKLAVGDMVGTQKGAFALLVFGDGSRVALREESTLTVRGFRYRPEDAQADQMAVDLLKGWMRKVSGEIARRNPRSFEMRVGDATIGIRGTDFSVRICDEACARARTDGAEGMLPQSRRLGQVIAAERTLRRQRDDAVDPAGAGAMLMLGDVLTTGDDQALIGLDDGTRIVLAPRSVLVLRSLEDEIGRRAVRLDLLQGGLRVAAAARPGARLYQVLVSAGATVGLRPDSALDAACEAAAPAGAYACETAQVLLRQGRADLLDATGARALPVGTALRLVEPAVVPSAPEPARPGPSEPSSPSALPLPPPAATPTPLLTPTPPSPAPPGGFGPDTIDPLDLLESEGEQTNLPAAAAVQQPAPQPVLTDPLDIPVEQARPATVTEQPSPGVYVAVFQGLVSVNNALGEVLVGVGEGAYVPLLTTQAPRALPAAPAFMEREPELDRTRLYPDMCVR